MNDRITPALTILMAALLLGCAAQPSHREAAHEPAPVATQGVFTPPSPQALAPTPRPVPETISITDAALLALENNGAFAVQKFRPGIQKTFEEGLYGEYDTVLSGQASVGRERLSIPPARDSLTLSAGATRTTIGGTTVEATLGATGSDNPDAASAGVTLNISQALLKGGDVNVNLAAIKQARIDTRVSDHELYGFALTLTANAENGFLRVYLAKKRLELVTQSLEVAKTQASFIEEQIRLGKLAELESSAALSEVAFRTQAVIDATSELRTAFVQLYGLLGLSPENGWDKEPVLADPVLEAGYMADPLEDHLALGLRRRPELNQARLAIERGDLEILRTSGGTLPRLDAFITLGRTGYAETMAAALKDIASDGYNLTAGLRGNLPWEGTADRAAHRRARVSREQAAVALKNVEDLATVDIRTAYIEVLRSREQIPASAQTRKYREAALIFETEKFRVGRSTNLAVVLAQRDLLEASLSELQAQIDYQRSLIELFRQDASLLARLGIKAPGAPAEPSPR